MGNENVGLPLREFLYTIDQIAFLLDVREDYVKRTLLFYQGRSVGVCPRDRMLAVDISPDDAPKPEWRIAERHLKRWMRFKGWRIRERAFIE